MSPFPVNESSEQFASITSKYIDKPQDDFRLYLFQKTAFEKEATCEFSKPVRLLFNAVRFSKIETQKKEIKSDLLLGGSPGRT